MPKLTPHEPIFEMDKIVGAVLVGNTPTGIPMVPLNVADARSPSTVDNIVLALGFTGVLELHLDASDSGSISLAGSAVTQWNDLSGNGRHVSQGTAGNRPTNAVATYNGLNSIRFDGGDILTNTSPFMKAGLLGSTVYTAYVVARQLTTSGTSARFVVSEGSSTDNDPVHVFGTAGFTFLNGSTAVTDAGIFTRNASGATFLDHGFTGGGYDGSLHVVRYHASIVGDTTVQVDNGTAVSAGTFIWATGTVDRFAIGGLQRAAAGSFINADICEVRIYSGAVTEAEHDSVSAELVTKWGI